LFFFLWFKNKQIGVLSMANSGVNTNGSQFFILFASAKHLDLKHSVFGRVVGGLPNLDKIEQVGADKKEKPLSEIKLVSAVVFTNPITEADNALEAFIKKNMRNRLSESNYKAVPTTSVTPASSIVETSNSKLQRIN
jgi:peptidyl-prolyl cis-trans isomerase-like protein 2